MPSKLKESLWCSLVRYLLHVKKSGKIWWGRYRGKQLSFAHGYRQKAICVLSWCTIIISYAVNKFFLLTLLATHSLLSLFNPYTSESLRGAGQNFVAKIFFSNVTPFYLFVYCWFSGGVSLCGLLTPWTFWFSNLIIRMRYRINCKGSQTF